MVKYELMMECRAGVRHAFRTLMIIKLPNGDFKLHKVCTQCKSVKFPTWNARGVIIKSATYKHSAEYRAFLNEHKPVDARVAILNSDIKHVTAPSRAESRKKDSKNEAKRSHVRSVHRAKVRRRNT